MAKAGFKVKVWGARGSLPVSGEAYRRFGGSTTSIEMTLGGRRLMIDAGSGILPAGKRLKAEGTRDIDLFLTHCHYDHVIGLPYFAPLYDPQANLTIWSGHLAGVMTTRQIVEGIMSSPWFPVTLGLCSGTPKCRDFRAGDVLEPAKGIVLRTARLNHPGGAIGYRVDYGGRSVAVITDTEHEPGQLDPEVMRLIEGVDLFFYDACYLEEEMARYRGYGHSTWVQGVKLAQVAGAKRVGFLHHDPMRTDAALDAIEREAQAIFPGAFCAYDGVELSI